MKPAIVFLTALVLLSCSKEKRSDVAAEKMQDFIISISDYARSFDPDFIIIPQNGVELVFNNAEPDDGFNTSYMSAIDGLGVEELFYYEVFALDPERLSMLRKIEDLKKIMVSSQ